MNRTDPTIGAARVAGTAVLLPAALVAVLAVWAVCTPFVFWRWTRPRVGWGRVAVVFGVAAAVHVPILVAMTGT